MKYGVTADLTQDVGWEIGVWHTIQKTFALHSVDLLVVPTT